MSIIKTYSSYRMARDLDYEFATATLHNSHYIHKYDNKIENKEVVITYFERLNKMFLNLYRLRGMKWKRNLGPKLGKTDGLFVAKMLTSV